MVTAFLITLFACLFLSVPIAFTLGLSSIVGMWMTHTLPMATVAQQVFINLNSFPLMSVPFFILAGDLMVTGGMSRRLVDFVYKIVGRLPGGLAIVAIITSMFFAAISGSAAATTAAIGAIMIPAMIARGYHNGWTSCNQAVSGALGVVIPPSIPLILYGVSAETSVGDLFLAGVLPGMFIGLSLILNAYFVSKKRGWLGDNKKYSIKEILISFKDAFLSLMMPIIVLGGIYAGVFTPTEASVIAVVYSFIISAFVYREINLKNIMPCLENAARTTATIMVIIGTAGMFGYFIAYVGIPMVISNFIMGITHNWIMYMIFVNVLLLIVGCFLNAAAAILILTPLLLPIALSYGIDPVHFGVVMIVNLAVGYVTPPVGMNLFVAAQISKMKLVDISKSLIPFMVILFIDMLIISYWPTLSLWLPNLMK